jgi:SAM-dependent methyltransferase
MSSGLDCGRCGASYPEIAGIRIIVLNPLGLLQSHAAQVYQASRELDSRREWMSRIGPGARSKEVLWRLERDYDARCHTKELLGTLLEPISQYLSRQSNREGFLSLLTSYHTGWPFTQMQPYFYKDWHGTEEARFVARLFSDAIDDFCGENKSSVVVLGSGAGGLLYHVSQYFTAAYGVDLSLLTMLLSSRLLAGQDVELSYTLPDESFPRVQRRVTVHGASRPNERISLLASNITNLPFVTSSVSCVITQYMMNLVSDQRRLASEINRVLVDGGLWINFSTPGSLTAFDLPTHLDLGSYAREAGFDLLESSMQRCKYLDFSEMSDWRTTKEHSNMFFSMRKIRSVPPEESDWFVNYFGGDTEALFSRSLAFTGRFTLSIKNSTMFGPAGSEMSSSIGIETWTGNTLLEGVVPGAVTKFLERVLRSLQGSNKVGHTVQTLTKEFGRMATEREIVTFLKSLFDMGVITFGDKRRDFGAPAKGTH